MRVALFVHHKGHGENEVKKRSKGRCKRNGGWVGGRGKGGEGNGRWEKCENISLSPSLIA